MKHHETFLLYQETQCDTINKYCSTLKGLSGDLLAFSNMYSRTRGPRPSFTTETFKRVLCVLLGVTETIGGNI